MKTSLKTYTSHFIWKVCVHERELETKQNCNILTPTLIAISVVSFLFSRAAQPGAGFLYCILSPTGLQTNRLPVFTELYNSSITHSISPITGHWDVSLPLSLEWPVWLSLSGNNCHAVHRSLSSGASVYDCTMGFYLVPYCQPSPPTPMEYATSASLEWHVWPGRRSIYNNRTSQLSDMQNSHMMDKFCMIKIELLNIL